MEVTLLANSVCLGQPCPELRVHISGWVGSTSNKYK